MWSAIRCSIIADGFRACGEYESRLSKDPSDFRQQNNPWRKTATDRTSIVIAGTKARVALVTNRSSFVRDSTATQGSLGHPTNVQGPTATEKAKWREHRLCRGLKCVQIGQSLSRWVCLSNRPWVASSDVWPPIMVPPFCGTIGHNPSSFNSSTVHDTSKPSLSRNFRKHYGKPIFENPHSVHEIVAFLVMWHP